MTEAGPPRDWYPTPPRELPAFPEPLHVGRPNVGDRARLHARLDELLDRRWLTNAGPLVAEFEERVAQHAGVRHAIAVCNATVGLQVLVRTLELRGEVVLPSFTFVASAHALEWSGLTPVFCDVDTSTHTLDPSLVAASLTDQTAAVLGVHLWGGACDVPALEKVADEHGVPLLFDSAHAFASTSAAGPVGSGGLAEVFSFHATKFVNAFEGGAIVTDDDALADSLRLTRNFGFADFDTVVRAGTNAKMSEMSAAMGLTSLESIERFLQINEANLAAYREGLMGLPGVRLLDPSTRGRSNNQYVVLEVDAAVAGTTRDALMTALHRDGVLARRYFYPGCHRMEPYRSRDGAVRAPLVVSERLSESVLVLPTGSAVSPEDVAVVCRLIAEAMP